MVRKQSPSDESAEATTAAIVETSMEEKMDLILLYLHRMDRRDKLRTIGGFFRALISLIPILLLLWSTWYFIEHGQEFMESITREAVRQSAEYTQGSLMDQLEGYMKDGQ